MITLAEVRDDAALTLDTHTHTELINDWSRKSLITEM